MCENLFKVSYKIELGFLLPRKRTVLIDGYQRDGYLVWNGVAPCCGYPLLNNIFLCRDERGKGKKWDKEVPGLYLISKHKQSW